MKFIGPKIKSLRSVLFSRDGRVTANVHKYNIIYIYIYIYICSYRTVPNQLINSYKFGKVGKVGKFLCLVCREGVGSNSSQFRKCWEPKGCHDIRGTLKQDDESKSLRQSGNRLSIGMLRHIIWISNLTRDLLC